MADQAIVSLGMFFANIFLARHLTPSEYGVFALLLTVSFCTTLVGNYLWVYPLGLRLPNAPSNERARLISGAIGVAATLCVAISGPLTVALLCLGRPELVFPAVSSLLFYQIKLLTRCTLLLELRQCEATAGDAVSSLGFVLLLIANRSDLSLANALYYMATAHMLGAIIQALQLSCSIKALCTPYRWLIEYAPLSLVLPPLVAGGVWTLRFYCLTWLLAALSGAVSVAFLQAAETIFNALNPLYFALAQVVFATTTRAFDGVDRQAAWRAARPYILIALPPVLLYLGAALLFPRFLLLVFYGQDSPFLQVGYLFPYLAMYTAALIPAELINSFFLGMGETRLVLRTNLLAITALIFSIPPIFATLGLLEGVCAALAVSEFVRLLILLLSLRRLSNDRIALFETPVSGKGNVGAERVTLISSP